jgi:hypothetical protein
MDVTPRAAGSSLSIGILSIYGHPSILFNLKAVLCIGRKMFSLCSTRMLIVTLEYLHCCDSVDEMMILTGQ